MNVQEFPDWVVERGKYLNDIQSIDPAKTALVVIDLQNAFVEPGPAFVYVEAAAETIERVNRIARALRAAGGVVAFTRHSTSDEPPFAMPPRFKQLPFFDAASEHFRPGTSAHALHPLLDQTERDIVVNKYRASAMLPNSSDLDARLRAAGIDTLIIVGTVTNMCCESTARDAWMMDYQIIFVSDATSAHTDAEHNATLMNIRITFGDVKSTDETVALIEARAV